VQVEVSLSVPAGHPVAVNWSTILPDGASGPQAEPAGDYTASSGTVTFSPGETTAAIVITVNGDSLPEPDESVLIGLRPATPGIRLGGFYGIGRVEIGNDD
jgi:hypothetical protein